MSDIKYNKRIWLNTDDSHYTGSIVLFDGVDVINHGKKLDRYSFVEISSCHGKVRIHKDDNLTMEDYIQKLKLLETEICEYRKHLESNHNQ